MNIYHVEWNIGTHMPFAGNLHNCLKNGVKMGMYTVQFFLGSPKTFARHHPSEEDIDKTLKLIARFPMNIFTHAPYLFNLAGSKKSLAWNGDSSQDIKTLKVIESLEHELAVLTKLTTNKSTGVVVHPGNYTNRAEGLYTIAKTINKINFPGKSKLLLENSAGQGTSLATTFEELAEIYKHVDEKKQEHIGFCVDTAHIYGYGLYDLSDQEKVENMFADFDRLIGLDKLCLIHLNDSSVPLGSKKDRHAPIGTGHIWGKSIISLLVLLDTCEKLGIPIVMETTPIDMLTIVSINKFKELYSL